eukprot:96185_1
MWEGLVSLILVIIVIIAHTSSIRGVTNSLACDGLVWNEGGYDQAIPAGVCKGYTYENSHHIMVNNSVIHICSDDKVVHHWWDNLDCSGNAMSSVDDICAFKSACNISCALHGCDYFKIKTYSAVTGCNDDDGTPSGYQYYNDDINVFGYCYHSHDMNSSTYTYTTDGVYIFKNTYDSSDCSDIQFNGQMIAEVGALCDSNTNIATLITVATATNTDDSTQTPTTSDPTTDVPTTTSSITASASTVNINLVIKDPTTERETNCVNCATSTVGSVITSTMITKIGSTATTKNVFTAEFIIFMFAIIYV